MRRYTTVLAMAVLMLASHVNGVAIFDGGYLNTSTNHVNNVVSHPTVNRFMVCGWVRWNDPATGSTQYAWSEASATQDSWTALQISDGVVSYSQSPSHNYALHTPSMGEWYFYVLEVDGTTLNAWVGDSLGTMVQVTSTVEPRETVTNVQFGALTTPTFESTNLDADVLYWAAFRLHGTTATDRAYLYNAGDPTIARMVFWIENTSAVQPWYFHDFSQAQPLKKNNSVAGFTETGEVAYADAHDYWGNNRTVDVNTVIGIPDCQAFWTFQEEQDVAPVDLIHGYTLNKGSAKWPRSTLGGGVFGHRALLFTGEEFLIVQDEAAPAIDIAGPDAEVSVVAWYRDYMGSVVCGSIAQMWPEQWQRQYALFRTVNAAGSARYFAGHICSFTNNGGVSHNDYYNNNDPNPLYNYEWARDNRVGWNIDFQMRVGIMTYDGMNLRVFRDGTYVWNDYGRYGPRNPYISGDGGGISDVNSEFTIGARVTQTPGVYTEFLTGQVAGVAIFNRALTLREASLLAGITGPTVEIDAADIVVITEGENLQLEAIVNRNGHNNAVTTWHSHRDGDIGVGDIIVVDELSVGVHTISAEAEEFASPTVVNTGAGVLDRDYISVVVRPRPYTSQPRNQVTQPRNQVTRGVECVEP